MYDIKNKKQKFLDLIATIMIERDVSYETAKCILISGLEKDPNNNTTEFIKYCIEKNKNDLYWYFVTLVSPERNFGLTNRKFFWICIF